MGFEEFGQTVLRLFPDVTATQMEQFKALEPLYREWNGKINVISRKDIDGLYDHHILHSLGIAAYLRECCPELSLSGRKILDLGCGGGFPGIPLAIMFPNALFTLCDSIGKKVRVAGEVAAAVGLGNVRTVNARAESLDAQYDWVVSRAVTSLDCFLPWIRGKYREGVLYLKGGDLEAEIASAAEKEKIPLDRISLWSLRSVFADEWFDEKRLVIIRK